MRYSADTPTEPGFYLVRGFRVTIDGIRERPETPTWEWPAMVYHPGRDMDKPLMYAGPASASGYVEDIGVYRDLHGNTEPAYDVEWARIPTPEEPGAPQRDAMSPDAFAQKMREIADWGDAEIAHSEADYLMLDQLDALGYREGVEAFRSMTRHYS